MAGGDVKKKSTQFLQRCFKYCFSPYIWDMKQLFAFGFIFSIVAGLHSCQKASNPNDENEHEAINKITMSFTGAGTTATFTIEDPDGDGGSPPTRIDTIRLKAGQTYTSAIAFKNLSGGTERDLTSVIAAQGKAHEVFYVPTGVTLTITKTDKDANGYPLVLNSTWAVGAVGSGSILLKLMHKSGIKGPNDAPTLGHSDIQIQVPVRITN